MVEDATAEVSGARVRITLDDFMTGLLAGLVTRGVRVVTIGGTDFYEAVVEVFNRLESKAEEQANIDLRFWLMIDEIHGDSPDIRDAITNAQQRRLVSLDNPTFQNMRMKLNSAEDAAPYLAKVPGGRELFLELADLFKSIYPAYA